MASLDLPELPQTRISPQLLVGAASPLWTYFGAVAAGGVAYWWMTQWTRPVNLEAMLGAARVLPAPTAIPAPIVEAAHDAAAAAETVVDATVEAAETAADAGPVGGEAAPVSPLLGTEPMIEADAAPESFDEATPSLEAAPEPILEEPTPFAWEPGPETAPKPRARKAVTPPADPEA